MANAEPARTEALLLLSQPVTGAVLGGRYHLLERIGRGGMADVFAAEDDLLSRRVAVKIFRFDLCTEDELRRVNAEMQTLAALHHPGLVTVYDAGTMHEAGAAEQFSSPYLVMELVKGPNLGQRLAEGALDQADVAQLGTELAATLAYVHARGVIHRDVKPPNILLDSTIADDAPFASKLTDFGIARVVDSTHYTEAGFTVGTANYLSPEQALSAEVGPPTDVYSLGLVLLECLTGALAYPGSGIEAALARLNRQPEIPAAFGSGWSRLLTAATERDPANRPTAAELGAELRALAAGGALSGPVPVPGASRANGASVVSGARGHTTSRGNTPVSRRPAYAGLAGPAGESRPVSGWAAAAASLEAAAWGDAAGGDAAWGDAAWGDAAGGVGGMFRPEDDRPGHDAPDEAATEAIRLIPADGASTRHRPHGGMIAASLLLLAALLTSGLLLRAGHAGGNQSPGAPVNFTSTTGPQSSARSSLAPSRAPAAAVTSVGGGTTGYYHRQAPVSTSVVTRTVIRSAAPPSSAPTNSATQPAPPPSSTSTSATSSSSPSSSSAAASPSVSPTSAKGRGKRMA